MKNQQFQVQPEQRRRWYKKLWVWVVFTTTSFFILSFIGSMLFMKNMQSNKKSQVEVRGE